MRRVLLAGLVVLVAVVIIALGLWRSALSQASVEAARETAKSAVSAAAGRDRAVLSALFGRDVSPSEVASMAALIPAVVRRDLKGLSSPFWNPSGSHRSVVQVQHTVDPSFAIDVELVEYGSRSWRVVGMRPAVAK